MEYRKIQSPVFQQICDRILEKECIPFLGSGVSNDAEYEGDDQNYGHEEYHRVKGMKRLLDSANENNSPFSNQDEKESLGEKCEKYLWHTSGKKQVAYKKLVETLKIIEMCHLKPTVAHHCIACIVREGLIPQIFTTNYDTCLERAFIESFGEEWKSNKNNRLSIILDLYSCSQQKIGKQGCGEKLHLFKINGCAYKLKTKEEEEEYCSKIILTCYQLQS